MRTVDYFAVAAVLCSVITLIATIALAFVGINSLDVFASGFILSFVSSLFWAFNR